MHGLGNTEPLTGSETPSERLLKLFSQTVPKTLWVPAFHVKTKSAYVWRLHSNGKHTCIWEATGGISPACLQTVLMHMFEQPKNMASSVQPCALMLAVFSGITESTEAQQPFKSSPKSRMPSSSKSNIHSKRTNRYSPESGTNVRGVGWFTCLISILYWKISPRYRIIES